MECQWLYIVLTANLISGFVVASSEDWFTNEEDCIAAARTWLISPNGIDIPDCYRGPILILDYKN